MRPDPVPLLIARIELAGGTLTTNGTVLRLRAWAGPLPRALLGELQIRRREVFRYLMEKPT